VGQWGFRLHIVSAFLAQARHQPTEPAICAPGTQFNVVSYGRLEAMINNIGRHALAAGLQRGHVVAIMTGDPIYQLALFMGLARIGVQTLSAQTSIQYVYDAAHDIQSDRPEAFADVVGDFLRRGMKFLINDQDGLINP